MKILNKWLTTLLAAMALFWAGCGDAMVSFDCDYDSDCLDEEYCVAGQCAQECSDDEECPGDKHCEVYQRQSDVHPVQVCLDVDGMDNDGFACSSHEECQEILGAENARCGMHDTCILVDNDAAGNSGNDTDNDSNDGNTNDVNDEEGPRYFLFIEQLDEEGQPLSTDDEEPSGEGEGQEEEEDLNSEEEGDEELEGPSVRPLRLGAVVVRDGEERAVGYGRLVDVEPAEDWEQINEPKLAEPDPRIPLDETEMCVDEPKYAPFVSVGGPGGKALIELVDEALYPVALTDEWTLQIIGDGPHCPLGPELDAFRELPFGEYRAFLCVQEHDAGLPEISDCEVEYAGPHEGYSNLEVTMAE